MEQAVGAPRAYGIRLASSNPIRTSALVALDLPQGESVHAQVIDVRGRTVRELLNGELLRAGTQSIVWDRRDSRGVRVAAGVYYVRATAGQFSGRVKVVVLE